MSTTINHGQLAKVDENGNVDVFYPKTFSSDVYVNQNKRSLANFLGNTDISSIGNGTITGAIADLNENAGGTEILQADYELLPEYEKTHGTYYIKDGGSASSLTVDQRLNNTSYNPISNKAITEQLIGTNLGSYESTTVASSAHGVYEFFMWMGQLVRTTSNTPIAIGDTISYNTNVIAINFTSELDRIHNEYARPMYDSTYQYYGVRSIYKSHTGQPYVELSVETSNEFLNLRYGENQKTYRLTQRGSAKKIESYAEVTYGTGVGPFNGAERVYCIRYTDGSTLVTGCLEFNNVGAGGTIFTFPQGYGPAQVYQGWFPLLVHGIPNSTPTTYMCIVQYNGMFVWSSTIPSGVSCIWMSY